MDQKLNEEKRFYKRLKKRLKKRRSRYSSGSKQRAEKYREYYFSAIFLYIPIIFWLGRTGGAFFIALFKNELTASLTSSFLVALSSGAMGYCVIRAIYINTLQGPENKKELDEWLWIQGRKRYILNFLSIIFFTAIMIVANRQIQIGAITVAWMVSVFLWWGAILLIISQPKLFTSPLVIGVGSMGLTAVASLTLPTLFEWLLYGFSGYQFDLVTSSIIILIILVSSTSINIYNVWRRKEKKLSIVQNTVLKTVHPERLRYALRPQQKQLGDQIKALKKYQKMQDSEPYAVNQEIAKLYAQDVQSKSKMMWGIGIGVALLTSFLGLIIGGLGEALVQDLLYPPLENLLCSINIDQFCP